MYLVLLIILLKGQLQLLKLYKINQYKNNNNNLLIMIHQYKQFLNLVKEYLLHHQLKNMLIRIMLLQNLYEVLVQMEVLLKKMQRDLFNLDQSLKYKYNNNRLFHRLYNHNTLKFLLKNNKLNNQLLPLFKLNKARNQHLLQNQLLQKVIHMLIQNLLI